MCAQVCVCVSGINIYHKRANWSRVESRKLESRKTDRCDEQRQLRNQLRPAAKCRNSGNSLLKCRCFHSVALFSTKVAVGSWQLKALATASALALALALVC